MVQCRGNEEKGNGFIPKVYEVCPVVGWVLFHFLADGKTDRFPIYRKIEVRKIPSQ